MGPPDELQIGPWLTSWNRVFLFSNNLYDSVGYGFEVKIKTNRSILTDKEKKSQTGDGGTLVLII